MDTSYLLKIMNRMSGSFFQPVREIVSMEFCRHNDGSKEINIRYKSGLTSDLKLHDFTMFEDYDAGSASPFNMLLVNIIDTIPEVNYLIDADGCVDHIWIDDEQVAEPVRDPVEYVFKGPMKSVKSIYVDLLMDPVKPVIETYD